MKKFKELEDWLDNSIYVLQEIINETGIEDAEDEFRYDTIGKMKSLKKDLEILRELDGE